MTSSKNVDNFLSDRNQMTTQTVYPAQVIQNPPMRVQIPQGLRPGDAFTVQTSGGDSFLVKIPEGI